MIPHSKVSSNLAQAFYFFFNDWLGVKITNQFDFIISAILSRETIREHIHL